MYYQLNKDVFFRRYGDIGYITSTGYYTDRVVDLSGAVFLAELSRKPRHIDDISIDIASQFQDVDCTVVRKDAMAFFDPLVEDGFLVSGETANEVNKRISGFTYMQEKSPTLKVDFTPEKERARAGTQELLTHYFLNNPQITSFQIELTSCCNERCVHCYIPHELKDGFIEDNLFYSVLAQLDDMLCWHITLSGGEPMLHPHFKEYLAAVKERDIYVTVLSNLTLLDAETIELLRQGNVSSVQVSLYSMDPGHHDIITQLPGSFEKTKTNIERLIANDIPVQISCPTMKENKNDFGEVIEWAHSHGIRATTDYMIMAEYNQDTSNLLHRLSPDECGEVIADVIERDPGYSKQLLSEDFEQRLAAQENIDEPLCGVGISSCCMVSNGNVYPCAGWQSCVCGTLNGQTLREIWLGSEKMQWLRSLRKRDMQPCVDCDKKAFCAPCMVRNANESPNCNPFDVNPYFCEVAEVNKQLVLSWREKRLAHD